MFVQLLLHIESTLTHTLPTIMEIPCNVGCIEVAMASRGRGLNTIHVGNIWVWFLFKGTPLFPGDPKEKPQSWGITPIYPWAKLRGTLEFIPAAFQVAT